MTTPTDPGGALLSDEELAAVEEAGAAWCGEETWRRVFATLRADRDAQDARWRALVGSLASALEQHRGDMHQRSSRPCATCRQSAAVLTQAQAALDGGA